MRAWTLAFLSLFAVLGCGQILGIDRGQTQDAGGGGAGMGGTGAVGGAGGVGASATTGGPGSGGSPEGGGGAGAGVQVPRWATQLDAVYLFESAGLGDDASMNGRILTMFGRPVQNGIEFIEGSNSASVPMGSGLQRVAALPFNSDEFSFGGWFYPPDLPSGGITTLVDRVANGNGFSLEYDGSSGQVFCVVARSGAAPIVIANTSQLMNSAWTFLACVFNGSELRLYVDDDVFQFSPGGPGLTPDQSAPFRLGVDFDGLIDEFFFARRALTEASMHRIRECRIDPPIELCLCDAAAPEMFYACPDGSCSSLGVCNVVTPP